MRRWYTAYYNGQYIHIVNWYIGEVRDPSPVLCHQRLLQNQPGGHPHYGRSGTTRTEENGPRDG
jgi:hypothetical protein